MVFHTWLYWIFLAEMWLGSRWPRLHVRPEGVEFASVGAGGQLWLPGEGPSEATAEGSGAWRARSALPDWLSSCVAQGSSCIWGDCALCNLNKAPSGTEGALSTLWGLPPDVRPLRPLLTPGQSLFLKQMCLSGRGPPLPAFQGQRHSLVDQGVRCRVALLGSA